ncbi:MAG: diacylglycerol kinase family protein [Bacteroidetes bacterium]|nr:diacylglycerol kinase family protein [Bacteroidota bacterium]
MSYIKKRGLSFRYAFNGLAAAFKEPNFRIQSVIALVVIALGIGFDICKYEWCIIIGCCILVLSLELVNSAIERMCNMVTMEVNPHIKFIKDICAAAVLIASAGSFVIGLMVFIPYLRKFFS